MIPMYYYELWDGGEPGKGIKVSTMHRLPWGKHVIITEKSLLKQPYNQKTKQFSVPTLALLVYDDGVEVRRRLVLDVRRKTDRQVKVIIERFGASI